MAQAGRDGYPHPSAKGWWSGQAVADKKAGEHVRTQCTEGHSGRAVPQKSGLYSRAMRGHKANRNWEQRLQEAYVTQPPFAQNWKRECPITVLQLTETIQIREAKTQGQRPLAAQRGPSWECASQS